MATRTRNRDTRAKRTVLATPVYEALKERIMDQALEPDARLNIDMLAAELKVSPTPVREALARLAAERLVTFAPFKGYSVMPLPTQRQLADLMHVRQLLEADAACMAASRAILADLRAMERELDAMEALHPKPRFRDFRVYIQHDQRFHERLVGASDNPVLLETYRSLNTHIQLARLIHQLGEVDYRENIAEHRAICEGLRRHDPDATVAAVHTHVRRFESQLGDFLDIQLNRNSAGP